MNNALFTIQELPVTDQLNAALERGFREHAVAQIGIDGFGAQRIAFSAQHEEVSAGIVVMHDAWGVLRIRSLFVEAAWRGRGIGRALMERAEQFARTQGLRCILLETMSFQALRFYKKLGFTVEFTRTGYDHGVKVHYLRKNL